MGLEKIIGREFECKRLQRCMDANQAQLIIVYGRRRVGKTFLINNFFNNRFDFKITGAYNQPAELQLRNFADELSRQWGKQTGKINDWIEAFSLLRQYIDSKPTDEKCIVFFDEMPWLDTQKSGFLPAFEWFWNDYCCAKDNLIFIACGSASSWIADKLDANKGGLFNRESCRIFLMPFTLHETELYLKSRFINWSRYDIAGCYMIIGGIPYYLSLLDHQLTLNDNIDNLFFRKRSELWDEFDRLYQTLFNNSKQYIKLVELLSKKRIGLTKKEIVEQSDFSSNGQLCTMLQNLIDSGFIRECSFYGNKKKETLYQLSDYYTLFYFKYIKNEYGKDEHFWRNNYDNPARRAWAGLSFEQLCKDHIPQIKQKLGISGVSSTESSWFCKPESEDDNGAQIDLLINRRDNVINLCEIKFSLREFEITKDYEKILINKADSFIRHTNCKKTLQMSMITSYGLKPNIHSQIINSVITLDDLFFN